VNPLPSTRYRNAYVCPLGKCTDTERVPFERFFNGWANGSQALKFPTTEAGWSHGSTKVMVVVDPSAEALRFSMRKRSRQTVARVPRFV
jgi:hypothetical protein